MAEPTIPTQAPKKTGTSTRCFVEYEIDLAGTELKLHTPALFKRVLKIGTKFFVVAELFGNPVTEYSLEIVQVSAMHYIPLSAKYIDSIVISGDKLVHFFVQPKGADTETTVAKELGAHEIRRPKSPPREEDILRKK